MNFKLLYVVMLLVAISSGANELYAQPDMLWSQTYDGEDYDDCYSIIRTPDGGFALCGVTYTFDTVDCRLVKTVEDGEQLWSQTYGGEDEVACYSIIQSADSGFILAGYARSFGGEGRMDFWLARTDEEGEQIWTQTYGGERQDRCFSVIQTPDGSFVLAGNTHSFGEGGTDAWLIKTEPDPVSVPPIVDPPRPSSITLQAAYPNPFNSKTTIPFGLSSLTVVQVTVTDLYGTVTDLYGREVARLANRAYSPGYHSLVWDAVDFPSGEYILRLEACRIFQTGKVVLLK